MLINNAVLKLLNRDPPNTREHFGHIHVRNSYEERKKKVEERLNTFVISVRSS